MDADRKAYLRRHSSSRLVQECLDGVDMAEARANRAHVAAADAIRAADALRAERDEALGELEQLRAEHDAEIARIGERAARAARARRGARIMQDGPQA